MSNCLLVNSTLDSHRHLNISTSNMSQLNSLGPHIQTFVFRSPCKFFPQGEGLELSFATLKVPWPKKNVELLCILPRRKLFPHEPQSQWLGFKNVGYCKISHLNLMPLMDVTQFLGFRMWQPALLCYQSLGVYT